MNEKERKWIQIHTSELGSLPTPLSVLYLHRDGKRSLLIDDLLWQLQLIVILELITLCDLHDPEATRNKCGWKLLQFHNRFVKLL